MLISGLLNSLNKSLSTNVVINSQKLISQSVLWQFCSGKTIHKNLYDILGINQEASIEQIKIKYYDLAKKYHPDTNSGQQEKFKQIYQAYQILGNNQKRKQYDQSIQGPYDRLRQEFGNDGHGPYDPEKMSYQTRKAYYNYSQPQWARIRRGVRPQSYTSYYSEQSMDRGPGDDAELEKFERKKATLKQMKQKQQQRRKEQTEKIRETIKKLDEENQKKHQQRLKKAQKQERRKILQSMERKWYGNFLQKMFAKLIHRGKYDDDDVKEKQPQKKDESKDQPSNDNNNQKKQK